jgi:hypothetical protein
MSHRAVVHDRPGADNIGTLQGTPLTGASGTEAFNFFEYLHNERAMFDFRTSTNIKASKNTKWLSVQAYLKRTGRVAD